MDEQTLAQLEYLYGNQAETDGFGLDTSIPAPMGWNPSQPVDLMGASDISNMIPSSPQITSQKIQELLGARQPDPGGMAQDILSSRFGGGGVGLEDYASGFAKSSFGTPTMGGDVASSRMNEQLKQMQALQAIDTGQARADLYRKGGTGTNGATMAIYQELVKNNPGVDPNILMSMAQKGIQGGFLQNGGVTNIPGASQAAGSMQYSKVAGGEQAQLEYAAPIEAAKMVGRGEITPVAAKSTGQQNMATILNEMKTKVGELDKLGGLVNPNSSVGQNIGAFAKNTSGGQFVQKAMGTKEQSIRNDIASMEPTVINSIRQATGMGAKAMDSNAELAFYRAAVRAGDVSAQLNAINRLFKMYGPGSNLKIPFEDTQAYEDSLANGAGAGVNPVNIDPNDAMAEARRRGLAP